MPSNFLTTTRLNLVMQTIKRKPRSFVPENFTINNWEQIEPYFRKLYEVEITSPEILINWLQNRSELESVIDEDARWRYIRLSCDVNNAEVKKHHEDFVTEIQPHLIEYREKLNKKFINNPFSKKLDKN